MTIVEKIKALFSAPAPEQAQFLDAKTADGQIIRISGDLAEGSKVEIIAEDGSTAPATGEHTLEDGTVLTLDENGIITAIAQAQPETEMAEAEPAKEEAKPETCPNCGEMMSAFEAKLSQLEEALSMLTDGLAKQKDEMNTVKAENEVKEAELAKTKTELAKVKAAPTVNFKAIERTQPQTEDSMLSRIQKLSK